MFIEAGIVAALLLARIEAGEVMVKPQLKIPPDRSGQVKLLSAEQLKLLKRELSSWGLAQNSAVVIEWLFYAELITVDRTSSLKLSPAAYTWLQLPPALAYRLLFEAIPLDWSVLSNLIAEVRKADGSFLITLSQQTVDRRLLQSLEILGLVEKVEHNVFLVLPEVFKFLELLLAQTEKEEVAELDSQSQLEIGAFWTECFPGNWPENGWLHETYGLFSFQRSRLGEIASFNLWQLFRLLQFCRPEVPAQADTYLCKADDLRIANFLTSNQSPQLVVEALKAGLPAGAKLPAELVSLIDNWQKSSASFTARQVVLLEAPERKAMQSFLSDKVLRSYVLRQLSPRYALLKPKELGRLQQLLVHRQMLLHLDTTLKEASGQLDVKLSRYQLQQIVAALIFHRRELLQHGYATGGQDVVIDLLENNLTRREQKEAWAISQISQESVSVREQEPGFSESLYRQLEGYIVTEMEVLIEYSAPEQPVSRRWVEPLALRVENGYAYLNAYCHLRHSPRSFRLDRLKILEARKP
jgi:hypothetical protein